MARSMLKRRREGADPTQCSWAIQVLQDEASELVTIAKHLGARKAKSGVAPAPFTGWVVQHDCCALVIHMKQQTSYESMVKNVRNWCGRTYMASLRWWDVVETQELGFVKRGASEARPSVQSGAVAPVSRRGCAGAQCQEGVWKLHARRCSLRW